MTLRVRTQARTLSLPLSGSVGTIQSVVFLLIVSVVLIVKSPVKFLVHNVFSIALSSSLRFDVTIVTDLLMIACCIICLYLSSACIMTSFLDMFNKKSNGNSRASPPEPPDKKSILLFVPDSGFGMSLPSVLAHSNLAFGVPLFFVLGLIPSEGFMLTAISVGAFLGFLLALLLLLVPTTGVALLEAGVLLFSALCLVSREGLALLAISVGAFLSFLFGLLFLLVPSIVVSLLGVGVLLFFALGMVSSKGFTLSATSLGVFLRFLLDTLFLLVSVIVAVFLGAFFRS
mmetsp:Transcript_15025/g.16887  ORF Transcript_15025/g.16887 Transcript_15025/m.16887 type:complete len:287 (-) Transcript_15025:75-935(-)